MKVKRTFYLDDAVANLVDQVALCTGQPKSDVINNALRVQLALPARYTASQLRALEELSTSILSIFFKNQTI